MKARGKKQGPHLRPVVKIPTYSYQIESHRIPWSEKLIRITQHCFSCLVLTLRGAITDRHCTLSTSSPTGTTRKPVIYLRRALADGPLETLSGWGIFELHDCFPLTFPLQEYFSVCKNIFSGLLTEHFFQFFLHD